MEEFNSLPVEDTVSFTKQEVIQDIVEILEKRYPERVLFGRIRIKDGKDLHNGAQMRANQSLVIGIETSDNIECMFIICNDYIENNLDLSKLKSDKDFVKKIKGRL